MANVAADVIAIIGKRAKIQGVEIKLTDRLDDLGVASIDALELVFDLEEKFNIQIPYNANSPRAELNTVGDIVNAVQKLAGEAQ